MGAGWKEYGCLTSLKPGYEILVIQKMCVGGCTPGGVLGAPSSAGPSASFACQLLSSPLCRAPGPRCRTVSRTHPAQTEARLSENADRNCFPTSAQKCRWLCDDLALGPQTVGNARITRETGGARETEVPAGFWCTLPTLWLGRVLGDTRAEFTLSRTSPSAATNSPGFLS